MINDILFRFRGGEGGMNHLPFYFGCSGKAFWDKQAGREAQHVREHMLRRRRNIE